MLDLSSRDRCFVIAEAGTCHAGNLGKAMSYVRAANGADCIKFQMFNVPHYRSVTNKLCTENIKQDMFCWIEGDEAREPRWNNSVMSLDDWRQVKEFTEACGMMFLASVFQHSTVGWLNKLGVEATKVASRAAEKFPYPMAPAPFLISTGMKFPERDDAIYLQCEANYPSTAKWFNNWHGFSDHSGTPWRAIDAISRGCSLIEVHFYIDEIDAGPDLPASLNLDELKLVCEARDAFAELRSL